MDLITQSAFLLSNQKCKIRPNLINLQCFSNKTNNLNLSVFSLITGINVAKTLRMHTSYECKCKFDKTNCKSNKQWNNDKCQCECKKHHICEKEYVWNPATCSCENGKYLASIVDDSVITCDDVIESYNKEINLNEKKAICKTQNFYILLAFLLITIALLIAVSTYCYLIKYQGKHLLPLSNTNNKSRNFYTDSINRK